MGGGGSGVLPLKLHPRVDAFLPGVHAQSAEQLHSALAAYRALLSGKLLLTPLCLHMKVAWMARGHCAYVLTNQLDSLRMHPPMISHPDKVFPPALPL